MIITFIGIDNRFRRNINRNNNKTLNYPLTNSKTDVIFRLNGETFHVEIYTASYHENVN
jgi:hypothetical protein